MVEQRLLRRLLLFAFASLGAVGCTGGSYSYESHRYSTSATYPPFIRTGRPEANEPAEVTTTGHRFTLMDTSGVLRAGLMGGANKIEAEQAAIKYLQNNPNERKVAVLYEIPAVVPGNLTSFSYYRGSASTARLTESGELVEQDVDVDESIVELYMEANAWKVGAKGHLVLSFNTIWRSLSGISAEDNIDLMTGLEYVYFIHPKLRVSAFGSISLVTLLPRGLYDKYSDAPWFNFEFGPKVSFVAHRYVAVNASWLHHTGSDSGVTPERDMSSDYFALSVAVHWK